MAKSKPKALAKKAAAKAKSAAKSVAKGARKAAAKARAGAKAMKAGAAKPKAAKARVSAVPKGFTAVTPHLVLDDCAGAIEFYKKAFGAKEDLRMPGPGGKIVHAEITIDGGKVMLNDEMPPMPGVPGTFKSPRAAGLATSAVFLYVKDVDALFNRAVKAGCQVRMPPMDMFWGDRFGQVIDPYGHSWGLGTHTEDVTPAEMGRRQQEFFEQMQAQGGNPHGGEGQSA